MTTSTWEELAERCVERFLAMRTFKEAQNLWHRFHEGKSFRLYLRERLRLVVPATLLIVFLAVTCAAAFVVFTTGVSGWLALPAILLMPVVLLGSLFVQSYVFFAWLENRAMAKSLRQRIRRSPATGAERRAERFRLDLGPAPSIPWVFAALFLATPLGLLATFAPAVALVLGGAVLLVPIVYARLDT